MVDGTGRAAARGGAATVDGIASEVVRVVEDAAAVDGVAYMRRPAAPVGPTELIAGGLDELTPAEWRVLETMAAGLSNTGIAQALHLSPRTVESHVKWIFRKLGLWPSEAEHRRVLAVRAFLLAGEPRREAAA
jgi:DNA-binding NarL/FixJ family response regulator